MTTEPRQEAERIVAQFGHAIRDAAIAWEQGGASQTETEAMWDHERRLVDALATAIEARDAIKWDYSFLHGRHGASLLIGHEEACEFNRALSALREDETT